MPSSKIDLRRQKRQPRTPDGGIGSRIAAPPPNPKRLLLVITAHLVVIKITIY